MGKKFMVMVLAVAFIAGVAYAADVANKQARVHTKALTADQMKAVDSKVHAALKAQGWTIYLHNRDGGRGVETDTLVFTDETVDSRNLAAKGYGVSNFGLFIQPDGAASWETMKTIPSTKDKAFLRGELRGSVMTGTVFMKSAKGQTSTFIFSTVNPATVTTAASDETSSVMVSGKGKK